MRLYEISDAIRLALADSPDGELTDDDLAKLDGLTASFADKADVICKLVQEAGAAAAARQAEVDRLKAGIRAAENRAARLKDYLLRCMLASGQRKVRTDVFSVTVQASPPSVTCTVDPETLPNLYQRVRIEPDKQHALQVWRQTGVVPDGFEIERGDHLRIR